MHSLLSDTTRLRRLLLIAILGLIAWAMVGPLHLAGDYYSFIIVAISYTTVITMSVSMLAGYCGIWPIGHTAFTAIGAYFCANLAMAGWPLEAILIVAVLVAAIVGFGLGITAGRFSVLYFGLLTLAMSLTAFELIGHWDQFTGGEYGIAVGDLRSALFGDIAMETTPALCILLATLSCIVIDLVTQGPIGRRWLAIKSQRVAAQAVGLVPATQNAIAFAFSGALAAVAGLSMAAAMAYLDPEAFSLTAGVSMLVGTVVGGTGSLAGAVVGAAFVIGVPELARGYSNVSPFVYGITMILVLLFLRKGVVPSLLDRFAALRRGKTAQEIATHPAKDLAGLVADVVPQSGQSLSAKGVSVTFGGVKALDDVSLDVAAGTLVGLIGPNGSGKTTFLNVLSGFYSPSSLGHLRLGSTDLSRLRTWDRMEAGFGRTFQHAELFGELTIRETLCVTARQGTKARRAAGKALQNPDLVAERIISALGLEPIADCLPSQLPFGIQKISDLARALAGGAGFIAMDEPFSGLDSEESGKLRTILRALKAAGVTILIIDHAVHEIFDLADDVTVLDFGSVLARGTPEQIRKNPLVQRAYFGLTTDEDAEADDLTKEANYA